MFITFEGIDGSGKSTQIKLLRKALEKAGRTVHVFREPGGTELSERVRTLLLDTELDIDPVTELLLFSSARAQLVSEKLKPLLANDDIVILDRYYDSTVAYQGYGRGALALEDIHKLNGIASRDLKPDITFYLKLSLEEALQRTKMNPRDRMERSGKSFFHRVIEGFDRLAAEEQRVVAVDATGSAGQTHAIISRKLDTLLR